MEVDMVAAEVVDKIQDAHYDAIWAVTRFNEILEQVASLCRIPGLQVSSPVLAAAGGSSVAMPKNFLHDLYLVTSSTYPKGLTITPSRKELSLLYAPDDQGVVTTVCLENRTLLFRPMPIVDEVLTVHYYKKPVELYPGDYFPDYIPLAIQKNLFKNYALKEAYLDIEDGIDGAMPNTNKYDALLGAAVGTLVNFYPDAPKARPDVQRSRCEF